MNELFGPVTDLSWTAALFGYGMFSLRYFLFAGIAFGLLYVVLRRRISHRKIQRKPVPTRKIWNEIKWSLSAGVIAVGSILLTRYLGEIGWSKIYTDWDQVFWNGWGVLAEALLIILVHDAYFYWMHRLSHTKYLFKHVHKVHHQSHDPTPFAAFSFHPLESLWEFGFLPLFACIIPGHLVAWVLFATYSTVLNVGGHLGFEFFPKGFTRHPIGKWHNTSTHHNLHHSKVHCNYSIYLNFWDRIMGTNYAHYDAAFDAAASRTKQQKLAAVVSSTPQGPGISRALVAAPGQKPRQATIVQAA